MENNFLQTYLLEILEEYEKVKDQNPSMDEFITAKLKEKGATEETIAEVKKSFALIDRNNENLKSLMQAKQEGKSRKEWLMQCITNALSFLGDNITKLLNSFLGKIQSKGI